MIPTVEQVKTRTLSLVDDDSQEWATNAKFQEAFAEGWDVMYASMLERQIDRIKNVATHTLASSTTELTPGSVGISDFGELIELRERTSGSSDDFYRMLEWDILPQREMSDVLAHFVWRGDTLYFIGANTTRELQLHYYASGTAPTTGEVGVDASLTFLSRYSAGVLLDRNGQHGLADRMRQQAVGRKFDQGEIGGDLGILVSPMVRALQRRPIQPRPFTLQGWPFREAVPVHITAQGASSTSVPFAFRVNNGTIIGEIDGGNATFYTPSVLRNAAVYLNGSRLTEDLHYTWSGNTVVFLEPFVPQPGADILIEGHQ